MAYSAIKETIFTGNTGRELRRHPAEVREVQFWLACGPGREPFGIFIFEPDMVAIQLGRPAKKVRDALDVLVSLQFCKWDEATQYVWVIEMAHHQFQTPLKAVDFRCRTAQKWYLSQPRNPFMGEWFDRYVDDFHLLKGDGAVERRDWAPRTDLFDAPSHAPSHAPSMGLVLSEVSVQQASLVTHPFDLATVPAVPAANGILKGPALDRAFDELWKAYPKAVERKEARAMFAKVKPTAELLATMLQAIAAQKNGRKWMQGYVPKLVNWLERECWHDKVEPMVAAEPQVSQKNSSTLGAAQRFAERRRENAR